MTRTFLSLTPLVLLIASCAPHPVVEVGQRGTLPHPARYEFSRKDVTDPLLIDTFERLAESGLTPGASARYLVQIGASDLPGKTGLFLPDILPDEAGQRQWLTSPTRSKSVRTRHLVVTVTDTLTGDEAYRAYGTERYRPSRNDKGQRLVQAVLAQLPRESALR